jgi:hypothetical protein
MVTESIMKWVFWYLSYIISSYNIEMLNVSETTTPSYYIYWLYFTY